MCECVCGCGSELWWPMKGGLQMMLMEVIPSLKLLQQSLPIRMPLLSPGGLQLPFIKGLSAALGEQVMSPSIRPDSEGVCKYTFFRFSICKSWVLGPCAHSCAVRLLAVLLIGTQAFRFFSWNSGSLCLFTVRNKTRFSEQRDARQLNVTLHTCLRT